MKKRINLLKKQKRFIQLQQFFSKFKLIIISEIIIFSIIYPIFFYLLWQKKGKIENLSANKKELLEFLIQNKALDAKFIYFRNKQLQISSIIRQSTDYFPYYNLLKESTTNQSYNVKLDSVLIDKSKTATFTYSFVDYTNLLDFLKYAESDEFLRHFDSLILVTFTKVELEETVYKLTFSGRFTNFASR